MFRHDRRRAFLCFLLTLACVSVSWGGVRSERFQSAFAAALRGEVSLNAETLSQYQYAFFAGLGGEKFIPLGWVGLGYFDSFRTVLREAGVANHLIGSTAYPPSWCSVERNCDGFFLKQLSGRQTASPEKLVVFAHSKGAAELFAFALKHSDWVAAHVHQMVFISGAMQGSPLANLVTGAPTRPVPWHVRLPASVVAAAAYLYMNTVYHYGTQSIRPEKIQALFERLVTEHPQALSIVLGKSLFLQTSISGLDPSPLMWLPDMFLRAEAQEPSDGLVPLSYQLPAVTSEALDSAHAQGVNHIVPCSTLLSGHWFSRVPYALATAALSTL